MPGSATSTATQTITSGFEPGEQLVLSAWGYMSASSSTAGWVKLYFNDANGNCLRKTGLSYQTETSYTQKSSATTVPAGTTSIVIEVQYGNGTGSANFYVDDISLRYALQ
jgi:hypothetical protein